MQNLKDDEFAALFLPIEYVDTLSVPHMREKLQREFLNSDATEVMVIFHDRLVKYGDQWSRIMTYAPYKRALEKLRMLVDRWQEADHTSQAYIELKTFLTGQDGFLKGLANVQSEIFKQKGTRIHITDEEFRILNDVIAGTVKFAKVTEMLRHYAREQLKRSDIQGAILERWKQLGETLFQKVGTDKNGDEDTVPIQEHVGFDHTLAEYFSTRAKIEWNEFNSLINGL